MAREYCNKCGEETFWHPLRRGSKREKCEKCGEVFPCKHKCQHLDCNWEKEEWAKQKKEKNS